MFRPRQIRELRVEHFVEELATADAVARVSEVDLVACHLVRESGPIVEQTPHLEKNRCFLDPTFTRTGHFECAGTLGNGFRHGVEVAAVLKDGLGVLIPDHVIVAKTGQGHRHRE